MRRRLARLKALFVLVLAPGLGSVSNPLAAAPGPDENLSAQLRLVTPGIRSNGPFGVLVTLQSKRSRVLTGHLEIVFLQDHAPVGRYRSPEWTVAPGEQSYRLLIPPLAELKMIRTLQGEVNDKTRKLDSQLRASKRRRLGDEQKARVSRLARKQGNIAKITKQLSDQLTGQGETEK